MTRPDPRNDRPATCPLIDPATLARLRARPTKPPDPGPPRGEPEPGSLAAVCKAIVRQCERIEKGRRR